MGNKEKDNSGSVQEVPTAGTVGEKERMIDEYRAGAGRRVDKALRDLFLLYSGASAVAIEEARRAAAVPVAIADIDYSSQASEIPELKKFELQLPFTPSWSDEFIHAADLFLPVCTMISGEGGLELNKGEEVASVNNFRVQEMMETNFLSVYASFSPDLSSKLGSLGKPAFLISFKTNQGRDIFVQGYCAYRENCNQRLLNPKGEIPDKLSRHVSVGDIEKNLFDVKPFDTELAGVMLSEFCKFQFTGVNAYFLTEIVTDAAVLLDDISKCFGGKSFMVASFECDSFPDMKDYLEGGFRVKLSFDKGNVKKGRSGDFIVPVCFDIDCLDSGKVCKGKLTIACPEVN